MKNSTLWTEKELTSIYQNMHLTPKSIHSVIPTRTVKSIERKKTRLLKSGIFLHRRDATIVHSLKRRNWNASEITNYMRAIKCDESARQRLAQCGLWNIKAQGVMA